MNIQNINACAVMHLLVGTVLAQDPSQVIQQSFSEVKERYRKASRQFPTRLNEFKGSASVALKSGDHRWFVVAAQNNLPLVKQLMVSTLTGKMTEAKSGEFSDINYFYSSVKGLFNSTWDDELKAIGWARVDFSMRDSSKFDERTAELIITHGDREGTAKVGSEFDVEWVVSFERYFEKLLSAHPNDALVKRHVWIIRKEVKAYFVNMTSPIAVDQVRRKAAVRAYYQKANNADKERVMRIYKNAYFNPADGA
jgi:hypothetical protein